jgi:hypothetical protein
MTPDAPDDEELFTRLVAAYSEARVAGQHLDPEDDPNVPDRLRPRLRPLLRCIDIVLAARPEEGSPAPVPLTDPDRTPVPTTVAGGAPPLPADLGLYGVAAGQRVGRFEVRRLLGSGSFGIVFLAFDPVLECEVALKVPQLKALLSPELRERFLREARAAAHLEHPNLVPVHEAGEADGVCYIVSTYCPGSTLATWLKQQPGPVPPDTAARLVLRLAEAVQYFHQRGIWHRDIKPGNVLLDPAAPAAGELPFTPRLTDFGLAVLAERVDATFSGVVGTLPYMAPEQTGGRVREFGPHTDVYGLGALLYEVLTGRPPFQGGTFAEVLLKVRADEPTAPRRLRKDVPPDLETICLKCLEKSPKKRYASAAELAGRLRLYLAGQPIPERPRSWPNRLWRAVRRRPLRAAAAALLGLALVGGLGAGYYYHPNRPRWELAVTLWMGRPYEFRGHERLPGPFKQVLGDPSTLTRDDAGKCFVIETLNTCLWELTPGPGCERYLLSCEVRHDAGRDDSRVGLYFGYREETAASGGRQGRFGTLTFADFGRPAESQRGVDGQPVSRAMVRLYLFFEEGGTRNYHPAPATPGVEFRPAIPGAGASPWRRLTLEVTPEGIKTSWADPDSGPPLTEEVQAGHLKRRLDWMQARHPGLTAPPAEHRPRSGIGLYVISGRASFRNLVVRPL